MKRLQFLLCILMILFISSCTKYYVYETDETINTDTIYIKDTVYIESPKTDEYYVKYYIKVNNVYNEYSSVNITYSLPNNKTTTVVFGGKGKTYDKEIIIGPFYYGSNIKLSVSKFSEHYRITSIYTEILVSKNNSPFAFKSYDEYTINY